MAMSEERRANISKAMRASHARRRKEHPGSGPEGGVRRGPGRPRKQAVFDQAKANAITNGHGANWSEWKQSVLAQLEDAEVKLKEQLDKVQRAQGAIREL